MGSDTCHLHLRGIRANKVYKSNHHSNVIDTIVNITATQQFNIGEVVMQLHAELLTTAQHVQRYQDPNRCGPTQFQWVNRRGPRA
jgi:hypothetical protein